LDLSGSGYGPVAGCYCEHGNEPSGSIKFVEFLEQTKDYKVLKIILLNRDRIILAMQEHLMHIKVIGLTKSTRPPKSC
jgi:hypothetical protein